MDGRHHLLGRRKQTAVAGDVDVRPGPAERAAGVALEPGVEAADAEDVEEPGVEAADAEDVEEPHPNVTALHDVYEDACGVHPVLELCSCGELFDRIKHLASDLHVPSIPPIPTAALSVPKAAELELYGITDDLREFVKSMTISTVGRHDLSSKELDNLRIHFARICTNGENATLAKFEQVLKAMKLEALSPLAPRVFDLFDNNRDDTVDVRDVLCGLSSLRNFHGDEALQLCSQMYNVDRFGEMFSQVTTEEPRLWELNVETDVYTMDFLNEHWKNYERSAKASETTIHGASDETNIGIIRVVFGDERIMVCQIVAWARLCKCLGQDFLPYMSVVMPPLLQSAQLKPDVTITSAESDGDIESDDDSIETITFGDKRIGIRTSVLEEKATACNMLCCYADELKEGFFPWIDQVAPTLVPLPKFYFHEEVRRAAVAAMPEILRSAKLAVEKGQAQGRDESYVKQLSDYIILALVEALHKEPEAEMCSSMLDSLNECMQVVPAWLNCLPIKDDKIEAKAVHEQLCSMVESQYLPKVVLIFAEVLCNGTELATDETKNRMVNVLRRFLQTSPPDFLASTFSNLQPQQQLLLQSVLSA
ncbi:ARM repeat superfamily protein [Zea mays]|uniref:ARM repeat superfamily protein n=1 Tax=Zea mays TaxID=4577 RepID=A0A1D6EZG2_MAIZE|nr:ARM repeat superfamily protein [Zea mays]